MPQKEIQCQILWVVKSILGIGSNKKIGGVQSNVNHDSPGVHFDFRFILMTQDASYLSEKQKSKVNNNEKFFNYSGN